jgi:hypothetical protein
MRGKKWTVTGAVVVLMVVGAIVSTIWARRSVHDEQARVRAAVARTYPKASGVKVVSCRVLPQPASAVNAAGFRGHYECVVLTDCRQTRRFSVPTQNDGTPGDAVAQPLGPPAPRSCT